MFILEVEKGSTVAGRMGEQGGRRKQLFQGVQFTESNDKWKWGPEADGCFSIASVRRTLSATSTPYYPYEWTQWVPKKVNLIAWRTEQGTIPTLVKRNIIRTSYDCPLCGEYPVSADHLFISCYMAANVWNKVSEWCKIPQIFALFQGVIRNSQQSEFKCCEEKDGTYGHPYNCLDLMKREE